MTPEECSLRWTRCQSLMQQEHIDLLVVCAPVHTYYLLGRIINGLVLLPSEGKPQVYVRRPVDLSDPWQLSPIYFSHPRQLAELLSKSPLAGARRMGIEQDSLSYNDCVRTQKLFPQAEVVNADAVLRQARAIKTPYEQAEMRRCGELYRQAYASIPSIYTRGMSDHEFSIALEHQMKLLGHAGIFRTFGATMESFVGSSILVGDNADAASPYDYALGGAGMSASLPLGENGTILREGQTMMVDSGGCFDAYMTDVTRVYSLGTLPAIAHDAHQCSLSLHDYFRQEVRVGMSCADVYAEMLRRVEASGLAPYFMGHTQQAAFVGHGVGLQINELPVLFGRSKDVITPGMAIALEPKFVLPSVGAVGIENTYLVHTEGMECITPLDETIIPLD